MFMVRITRDFGMRRFNIFSERGGYPIVHKQKDVEWAVLADQLNRDRD